MSGKRAKLLRKNNKFSKKAVAAGLGLCIGTVPVAAGDIILSLYPHVSMPIGPSNKIESGIGGGAKITWRPFDFLNTFVYGDYLSLALPNVDPISMVDGGVGTGYHLGITDHIAMDFNLQLGAYNAKAVRNMSGLTGGVSLTFTYRINPIMSADVHASGSHYAAGSKPLMTLNAAVSPGLSINFTELFSNKTKVGYETQEVAPVFPVLYSWYENNSFGTINVTNNEDSSITDITVSFYQPQYMSHPKECAKIDKLAQGESSKVDLYAFFNEQMLELTEKTDTQATITVEYSCLGQKRTQKFSMIVPVYGRNNMSWDDDRRAAVFVSSKDPAAMLFAKYVTSVVRDNVRNGVPSNLQYAMGIFEVLDQFGLSYVIDPTSAFEDNVGTSSIDFLQFPYQTLMYRGGDCDDLSILVCSLFEAVGIRTAFITIPGHIFMAFDLGLTPGQAQQEYINLSEMIIDNNEVWVPLEITLSDEGFYKAWKVGAREWNSAYIQRSAQMYKMEDSWKTYAPVSVPGASAFFTMPDRDIVAKLFNHSVDQWITKLIEPQIATYEAKLSVHDDAVTRNKLGVLYGKYGLFVQADEQFKKARRQGYTPSVINTGNVYFSMQDYDRARRWYKSVLQNDPENVLAYIGIARCSYELTDYKECDSAYAKAMALDPKLAKEYAYLGSFVSSKGRAFSLSDRLQNTIWSEEQNEVSQTPEDLLESARILQNKQDEKKEETVEVIMEEIPVSDSDFVDLLAFDINAFALAPETEQKEEDDLEDYDIAGAAGDGDDDDDNAEPALAEDPELPEETEADDSIFIESFTGLLSEVALDINDFVYEDESDVEIPEALLSEEEKLEIAEISIPDFTADLDVAVVTPVVSEVVPEVAPMEVPRFTEQPSAQWAPEEAYVADVIPGMKSFEEEMGDYQNGKAYLYEETAIQELDPENDVDIEDLTKNDEMYVRAGLPDVNPFSSYLSAEDAKAVEEITNYSLEEAKKEAGIVEAKVEIKAEPVQPRPVVVEVTPVEVEAPKTEVETPIIAEIPALAVETPAVAVEIPVVVEAPAVAVETPVTVETPAVAAETPMTVEFAAATPAEIAVVPAVLETSDTVEATAVIPAVEETSVEIEETPKIAEEAPVEAPAAEETPKAAPATSTATAISTAEPAASAAQPATEAATPAEEPAAAATSTAEPADELAAAATSTATATSTAQPAIETAEPADEPAAAATSTAEPATSTAAATSTAQSAVSTAQPAASTATPAVSTTSTTATTAKKTPLKGIIALASTVVAAGIAGVVFAKNKKSKKDEE